jgi:hypothetical protein
MARFLKKSGITTILSPGQRFQQADQLTSELTVARLVTDRLGLQHVTLRASDGREISAFVEQVEAAIAEGQLTPILSTPHLAAVAC